MDPKEGGAVFDFYNDHELVPLTKQTGAISAPKSLRNRFGRRNKMKNFRAIDELPPVLGRYFGAATKFSRELLTDIEIESIPLLIFQL